MTQHGKCEICRSRKVKCDEIKPICGPCSAGGRPCSYNKARQLDGALRLKTSRRAPGDSGVFHVLGPNQPRAVEPAAPRDDHRPSSSGNIDHLAQRLLLSNAAQHQILGLHIETFSPRRRHQWPKLHTDLNGYAAHDWLPSCYEVAFSDPMLTDVVMGFALGHLMAGSDAELAYPVLRQQLYRRAYLRLRGRLEESRTRLEDSVLATVMLLGSFEGERGLEGCLAHVKGAAAVIQARGEKNFETQLGKELYYGHQLTSVVVCWFNSSPLPEGLDDSFIPTSESTEALLLNILWRLPGLTSEAERLCADAEATTQDLYRLYCQLQDVEAQLSSWQTTLTQQQRQTRYEEPSFLYQRRFPDFLKRRICFASVPIARQLVILWTAQLVFSEAKARLAFAAQQRKDVGDASLQIAESLARKEARAVAVQLLKSMEFFLHPDMGSSGISSVEVGASWLIVKLYCATEGLAGEMQWLDLVKDYGDKVLNVERSPWECPELSNAVMALE